MRKEKIWWAALAACCAVTASGCGMLTRQPSPAPEVVQTRAPLPDGPLFSPDDVPKKAQDTTEWIEEEESETATKPQTEADGEFWPVRERNTDTVFFQNTEIVQHTTPGTEDLMYPRLKTNLAPGTFEEAAARIRQDAYLLGHYTFAEQEKEASHDENYYEDIGDTLSYILTRSIQGKRKREREIKTPYYQDFEFSYQYDTGAYDDVGRIKLAFYGIPLTDLTFHDDIRELVMTAFGEELGTILYEAQDDDGLSPDGGELANHSLWITYPSNTENVTFALRRNIITGSDNATVAFEAYVYDARMEKRYRGFSGDYDPLIARFPYTLGSLFGGDIGNEDYRKGSSFADTFLQVGDGPSRYIRTLPGGYSVTELKSGQLRRYDMRIEATKVTKDYAAAAGVPMKAYVVLFFDGDTLLEAEFTLSGGADLESRDAREADDAFASMFGQIAAQIACITGRGIGISYTDLEQKQGEVDGQERRSADYQGKIMVTLLGTDVEADLSIRISDGNDDVRSGNWEIKYRDHGGQDA